MNSIKLIQCQYCAVCTVSIVTVDKYWRGSSDVDSIVHHVGVDVLCNAGAEEVSYFARWYCIVVVAPRKYSAIRHALFLVGWRAMYGFRIALDEAVHASKLYCIF